MERVIAIEGDIPLLLIAPHGPDDENTALLGELIQAKLGCYLVANNGFERADYVDESKDKANCNNVEHCKQDIVKDEFLDPIVAYTNRIEQDFYSPNIFILHGMIDIPEKRGRDQLDMVLGYGEGNKKNSYSCDLDRKNAFVYALHRKGLGIYTGSGGGKYAGAGKNNLNQYFRKWEPNPNVHSMQIEIIHNLRKDKASLQVTADFLADAMSEYLEYVMAVESEENGKKSAPLPKGWVANWEAIAHQKPSY